MSGSGQSEPLRQRVIYVGRVQGVCFRATTADIAGGFRVVGWVRNLRDGSVEMEAEGPPDELNAFLAAIAERFVVNITDMQLEELPARGDEARFEIRY